MICNAGALRPGYASLGDRAVSMWALVKDRYAQLPTEDRFECVGFW